MDKFRRQKYLAHLEKISKNLFRLFRNEQVKAEEFKEKFEELKRKSDTFLEVQTDSEYHKQLELYIERLYFQTCKENSFDNQKLLDIREGEMSQLNRLQKLKNSLSYKKEKHKIKHFDQDWG